MLERKIFMEQKVDCPYCSEPGIAHRPIPGLYWAKKKERDHHVVEYKWSVPKAEHLMPHHYAVWQCPVCLFADFLEDIQKPKRTFKSLAIQKAFGEIPPSRKAALMALRQFATDEQEIPPLSAAALHLAALIVVTLAPPALAHPMKIARLALRLGWFFREASDIQSISDHLGACLVPTTMGVMDLTTEDGAVNEGCDAHTSYLATLSADGGVRMPENEDECLRMAAGAFEHSYSIESSGGGQDLTVELLSIALDLHMRTKEYLSALSIAGELYNRTMKSKRSLRNRLTLERRRGSLRTTAERDIQRRIDLLEPVVLRAAEARREVLDCLIEPHRDLLREVQARSDELTSSGRERYLQNRGVPKDVVDHLKSRGLI